MKPLAPVTSTCCTLRIVAHRILVERVGLEVSRTYSRRDGVSSTRCHESIPRRALAVRILVAHSKYLSGDASGENRVVADEVELLTRAGHDVTLWAPQPPDEPGPADRLTMGINAVWSRNSSRQLGRKIRDGRAEIVHFHNLYPMLSPAVLRSAFDHRVAVVMTLHNYRYSCLPATFFRQGAPCEDCLGKIPWRGVVHRCYRNSLSGSATLAAALSLHRAANSFDRVDQFLAISAFVKKMHVDAGLPGAKILVKTHFSYPMPRRIGVGDYFLFLGRIAPEKGLESLLAAWTTEIGRLVVAGDGPDAARLRRTAPPGVEFIGTVAADAVPGLLSSARAVVVPSKCYEGAGKVVMEAYAAGVPVVSRRIGALDEVVDHARTGLLVDADAPENWRDALSQMNDDSRNGAMGRDAHELWRRRFSPEIALREIENAYDTARGKTAQRLK
jgi:glycosyltransferase involved in cell wall biosynthesis